MHDGSGSNKTGLELWRLPKHTFDRSSAFNDVTVLEIIWGMPAAKKIQEVMPKMSTLYRAHQEYAKQSAASRDAECWRMKPSGSQLCLASKKADVLKILPDGMTKDLNNKATNNEFERHTHTLRPQGHRCYYYSKPVQRHMPHGCRAAYHELRRGTDKGGESYGGAQGYGTGVRWAPLRRARVRGHRYPSSR